MRKYAHHHHPHNKSIGRRGSKKLSISTLKIATKNRTHKVSCYRNSPLGNKQLDYVNIEDRVKLSKAWAPYSYANHECVFKFIGYEYKSSPARSRNYKTEVQ